MSPIESVRDESDSPDGDDRIQDFWARHGGPSGRRHDAGETAAGLSGWSEIFAADGYVLRCEWTKSGERRELQFIEKPPRSAPIR
jgi:hypothetical protein